MTIMQKNKLLILASLIGMSFVSAVQAADQFQDQRWYAAPFATFIITDQDRKQNNGWGGGMGFGKILDQHFNIELKGFAQGYSSQSGSWNTSGGSVDTTILFFPGKIHAIYRNRTGRHG